MIERVHKAWIRLSEWGAVASMSVLVAAVVIQVTSRFLLPKAPSWTEELARIAFVYLVGFGAGLAVRAKAYVYLETLAQSLGAGAQRVLHLITQWILFFFCCTGFYYSMGFVRLGLYETSPALGSSMVPVFLSLPLLFGTVSFALLGELLTGSKSKKESA
jgi:TRAP-type transport system small permease protein